MERNEKKRQGYTRQDEANMWMFLFRELRQANGAAYEPKGRVIWEQYVRENRVNRTADSLTTHFRRHMFNNLYNAALECNVMMFIYRRLRIKMDSPVKKALELKFSVEIELSEGNYVKTFKKVMRPPGRQEQSFDGDNEPINRGKSAQNKALTKGRTRDELHVSSDEGSVTPPPLKRSSLDYTRQIQDVVVNSRFEARYKKRPSEIHDEDFESFEGDQPSSMLYSSAVCDLHQTRGQIPPPGHQNSESCDQDAAAIESSSSGNQDQMSSQEPQISESPDIVEDSAEARVVCSKASQDQFSPSEEQQLLESSERIRITTATGTTSNTNQGTVVNPAFDGQQCVPQLDPILVSETSDTCESAYHRLYGAIANPSTQSENDPNAKAALQTSTLEWQNRIEQMLEKYEISGTHAENFLEALFKAQKNLLGRDQENYQKSLDFLEKFMEELLLNLKEQCKPVEQRPLSCATKNPGLNLMQADSIKVPQTVRKQKVVEVFRCFDRYNDSLTFEEIADGVKKLEGLAAQMPEQYDSYMSEVKEAVEERLKKINSVRYG